MRAFEDASVTVKNTPLCALACHAPFRWKSCQKKVAIGEENSIFIVKRRGKIFS
jgi:hypothetical protein